MNPADVINWHAHIHAPKELEDPFWARSPLHLEKLIEIHDQAGIGRVVVTDPIHYLKTRTPAQCLEALKVWNEYAGGLEQKYKGRLTFFSSTVPGLGDEFVKELEHAIKDNGLHGVFIASSHQTQYPDEDACTPFWDLVTELDIPVMLHAPPWAYGEEKMRDYRLASSIGRPGDECLAVARLIVYGVLERYPTVKLLASHLAGGISEVIGRMDYAYELQEEAYFLGPYSPMRISMKPSEYLRRIYMDSVSYHQPALMCAIQTIGAGHLVFGADAPPLYTLLPRALALVEGLPIPEAERDGILRHNALRLLERKGTVR